MTGFRFLCKIDNERQIFFHFQSKSCVSFLLFVFIWRLHLLCRPKCLCRSFLQTIWCCNETSLSTSGEKADPKEKVTVIFKNKRYKTKADKNGRWLLTMPPHKAEAVGQKLVVKGKRNAVILEDVLVGDVWICSGQSNMEWIMGKLDYAEAESQQADYQNIRLLTIDKNISTTPVYDVTGVWQKASATNVLDFSAVAYYFGKKLHKDLHIPIGLISTNYGGTNVEA